MVFDGGGYLASSFFGGMIFIKASGEFVNGAYDVLNVSFAENTSGEEIFSGEESESSLRLGILFAVEGVAGLVGLIAAEALMNMEKPKSLQLTCIYA